MKTHILQPLDSNEVQVAVHLLKNNHEFNASTRFVSIMLKEPAKELIYAINDDEKTQNLPDREAIAVLFDNSTNRASTITLNLTQNEITKIIKHPEGNQPSILGDETDECEHAVITNPEFKAMLKKHYGVEDTSLVMVDIWSAGYYGVEEERTRRLVRPLCFLRSDPKDNGYTRPLEGIRPVVDMNTMKVIRVEEYGKWALPSSPGNYSAEKIKNFRTDIKPLHILQPEGPSFILNKNHISWQKWDFTIGFNAREGLTIHHVRYEDKGRKRPILFRGSLDEMVVPYGDPTPAQKRKNAFDVGEYGIGTCANSLQRGCDCLGHIEYLDAHLCDSRGRELNIPNAVCIHEEDFGILWKHTDRRLPDSPEVRRSRRLVVSSISTVENYEYGFYWHFYQDGTIQFEVKLSGILSLGCAHPGETPKWGTMVAPLVYAPNHQHFFNVRLDFGIDGIGNTIQRCDVIPDPIDEEANPYENAFHVVATDLKTEQEAMGHLKLETARTWKIINPVVKNYLGQSVGYKFIPGENAIPFASPNSWWRKRAGFVNNHVWVTPFNEDEKYAAGDFPNQSQGGDGLMKWTKQDRSIENQDIVVWYTFGHTHIPRVEDYPVMPAARIGFTLKPNGFFDENPALDVPPSMPITTMNGSCPPTMNGSCHRN
uniref:Amine oxidase n=1 Tax=Acrobeloides nanus TaxID=290746 RepID=A0A914C2W9_9BILA